VFPGPFGYRRTIGAADLVDHDADQDPVSAHFFRQQKVGRPAKKCRAAWQPGSEPVIGEEEAEVYAQLFAPMKLARDG
jgi:hypothetical protein